MTRTYLITGGGGNLSRQLASQLVADGDQVILFDVVEQTPDTRIDGCPYVRGDLREADRVDEVIKNHRPDVLLHMASLLSGKCEQDRTLGWQTNVMGGFNVFEAALRHQVQEVFFPSSLASFGGHLPDPLPEDIPQWPDGLYGVSKVACERLGNYYHSRHGMDFRGLRLPIVLSRFGPAGAASSYASRAFVESVRSGHYSFKVNPTTAAGTVYVRDALEAIKQLVKAPAGALKRRVYNIHAIAPTAQQIATAIQARLPKVQISFDPDPQIARLIESWPKVIEDGSARRDWQWSPQFDLDSLADDFIQELERESAGTCGI